MPTILRGSLVPDSGVSFDGYLVRAEFERRVPVAGTDSAVFLPGRAATPVRADRSFALEIPDEADRRGDITLLALTAVGLPVGRLPVRADGPFTDLVLEAGATPSTKVTSSDDITLGGLPRYSGRVIDPTGKGLAADLLIVLWAVVREGEDAAPVSVARTASGGYFSAPWPSDTYMRAHAVVSGGAQVPVVLESGRLPVRMILVVPQAPESAECDCHTGTPPRAPGAEDLAASPAAFATDLGHCTDFTVPNRTVEEATYLGVVRTTQPLLKPAVPAGTPPVPRATVNRLVELAALEPRVRVQVGSEFPVPNARPVGDAVVPAALADNEATARAFRVAAGLLPGIDLDSPAADAETALAARLAEGTPLRLEASVAAELARETTPLTAVRLLTAEQSSLVRAFRGAIGVIAAPPADRFRLGEAHQIDWDAIPDAFQATTIAHGHLLTFKQVWKADGYSQGDLLYSLPLAPGQQKLVSVLDWTRQEVTARRSERLETEELTADLDHDRDVTDIIRSTLRESMDATSHADSSSVGGGLAGFIGPLVFGAAGGVSSAGSTANQTSARSVTGSALNQVRDRTAQAASAVRSQRSTVVQTSGQGEAVRAMTEAVANYNHCHAMTVEYFEVLRHFQVSQELAQVQECLFVPFAVTPFTEAKALRWRRQLRSGLRQHALASSFDVLERVSSGWRDADVPTGRYADEPITHLDGELWIRLRLPRPADGADGGFVRANWSPYANAGLLWDDPANIFTRYLGVATAAQRDAVWDRRIAPGVAERIVGRLRLDLLEGATPLGTFTLDPTLVTPFQQDRPLLVGLSVLPPLPSVTRARVGTLRLSVQGVSLPPGGSLLVETVTARYRTGHFSGDLVSGRQVSNDLSINDPVNVATPLSTAEKTNPREHDRRDAQHLLDHLNEHVEHYHRAIWLTMDPNRRYLLLDGFVAPDAGGRSVASVVDNRVVGIVGNSLVMPVAPGQRLDPTYEFARSTPEDLRHLYAADPPAPMRISVPTPGVFAEAVLGSCNSCELIDDTRFWRWEDAPLPDLPTPIAALSTDSRRTAPPGLAPDQFPDPVVRLQDTPAAPAPSGLAAAFTALGTPNIFRDLTGLVLNQQNAAEGLKTSITAAQGFASRAGALAQQQFMNQELDRSLSHIKQARDKDLITAEEARTLTESALRGAIGEQRPQATSATASPEIKRAMERVTKPGGGTLRVTRPEGSVSVKTGTGVPGLALDVDVDPPVEPMRQPSDLTCWAAGGTMMDNWRAARSASIETVLGGLGGEWLTLFQQDRSLTPTAFRAFMAALGLVEEGAASYTPEGLARLVREVGPLLEIGDDGVENNALVHVRIIVGVHGDGTTEGTTVTLADSATGVLTVEKFTRFDARHGAHEPVVTGLGIFHF
ncbi:papain-like cysteine protease family protein [Streptomyces sp. NPDC051001]|uniref:papain-like cysteine protease family protein n=1 Tax=Streptomyces sp. NPDC051001 TaxID=3155795 RepID=UPI003428A4AB